jgi:hypothetical protein
MSKIEDMLRQKLTNKEYNELGSLETLIKTVVKEYATWYANKCLNEYDDFLHEYNVDTDVLLLEFELPSHD